MKGIEQNFVEGLFADNAGLLADNERKLQRTVDELTVCRRRKWRENVGKQGHGI